MYKVSTVIQIWTPFMQSVYNTCRYGSCETTYWTRHLIWINSSLLLHWRVHGRLGSHTMLTRPSWRHPSHGSCTRVHRLALTQEIQECLVLAVQRFVKFTFDTGVYCNCALISLKPVLILQQVISSFMKTVPGNS